MIANMSAHKAGELTQLAKFLQQISNGDHIKEMEKVTKKLKELEEVNKDVEKSAIEAGKALVEIKEIAAKNEKAVQSLDSKKQEALDTESKAKTAMMDMADMKAAVAKQKKEFEIYRQETEDMLTKREVYLENKEGLFNSKEEKFLKEKDVFDQKAKQLETLLA